MHDDGFREPGRLRHWRPADDYDGPEPQVIRRPRRRWLRGIAFGLMLFLIGGVCTAAAILLLIRTTGDLFGFIEKPAQADVAPSGVHPIARQAAEWGIFTCRGKIANLAEFLTRDADYNWLAQRGKTNADQQLFSAAIAIRERATGRQGISGLYAAPVGQGECNAAYQTTIFIPQACAEARTNFFPTYSTQLRFGDAVAAYTNQAGDSALYLMPADGAGCVIVKSELAY